MWTFACFSTEEGGFRKGWLCGLTWPAVPPRLPVRYRRTNCALLAGIHPRSSFGKAA